MWLMQALGLLLSALPVEEILENVLSLITPYIQQLEKLAEEVVSQTEAALKEPGVCPLRQCFPSWPIESPNFCWKGAEIWTL